MQETISKLNNSLPKIRLLKQTYEKRRETLGVSVDDSNISELARIEEELVHIIPRMEEIKEVWNIENAKVLADQIALTIEDMQDELEAQFTGNMSRKLFQLRKDFMKEAYDKAMAEEGELAIRFQIPEEIHQDLTGSYLQHKIKSLHPQTPYWYRYHSLEALKEMVDYQPDPAPFTSMENVIEGFINLKLTKKKTKSVDEASRLLDAIQSDEGIISPERYKELETITSWMPEQIVIEEPQIHTGLLANLNASSDYNEYKNILAQMKTSSESSAKKHAENEPTAFLASVAKIVDYVNDLSEILENGRLQKTTAIQNNLSETLENGRPQETTAILKEVLQKIQFLKITYEKRKEIMGISVSDFCISELARIEVALTNVIPRMEQINDVWNINNAKMLVEQIASKTQTFQTELEEQFLCNMSNKLVQIKREYMREEYDKEMEKELARATRDPTLLDIIFLKKPPYFASPNSKCRYITLAIFKEMLDYRTHHVPWTSMTDTNRKLLFSFRGNLETKYWYQTIEILNQVYQVPRSPISSIIKWLINLTQTNKNYKSVAEAKKLLDAIQEDGNIVSEIKYKRIASAARMHPKPIQITVPKLFPWRYGCTYYDWYKWALKKMKRNAREHKQQHYTSNELTTPTRSNNDIMSCLNQLSEIVAHAQEGQET